MPALLNSRSRRPKASVVFAKACATDAGSATSIDTASMRPSPALAIEAVSSRASVRRPVRTTEYPFFCNKNAVARPMPLPAPVMNATLPSDISITPCYWNSIRRIGPTHLPQTVARRHRCFHRLKNRVHRRGRFSFPAAMTRRLPRYQGQDPRISMPHHRRPAQGRNHLGDGDRHARQIENTKPVGPAFARQVMRVNEVRDRGTR